jgi:hypothetical protein
VFSYIEYSSKTVVCYTIGTTIRIGPKIPLEWLTSNGEEKKWSKNARCTALQGFYPVCGASGTGKSSIMLDICYYFRIDVVISFFVYHLSNFYVFIFFVTTDQPTTSCPIETVETVSKV